MSEPSRAELAAALQQAVAKRDAEAPRALRAKLAAHSDLEKLQASYAAGSEALRHKLATASNVIATCDRDVQKALNALVASADPRIEALACELRDYWDHFRNHDGAFEADRGKVLPLLERVKHAREQLETLKLDVTADVDAELARIFAETGIDRRDFQRVMHRRFS